MSIALTFTFKHSTHQEYLPKKMTSASSYWLNQTHLKSVFKKAGSLLGAKMLRLAIFLAVLVCEGNQDMISTCSLCLHFSRVTSENKRFLLVILPPKLRIVEHVPTVHGLTFSAVQISMSQLDCPKVYRLEIFRLVEIQLNMSNETCNRIKLLKQNPSAIVVRRYFHVTFNVRQNPPD